MATRKAVHQLTAAQFDRHFPDEEACCAYLVARRWPEGVHCPRCIEKIAAALTGVEGLQAADANLMGEISVRVDDRAAHDRVQAALEGAGFPVASVRPA